MGLRCGGGKGRNDTGKTKREGRQMKRTGQGRTAKTTGLWLMTSLVTTSWTNLMTKRQTNATPHGRQTDMKLETRTGTWVGATLTGSRTDTVDEMRVTGGQIDIKQETPLIGGVDPLTGGQTDIRVEVTDTRQEAVVTGMVTGDNRVVMDVIATCTDLIIADDHRRLGSVTKGLSYVL